MDLWNYGKKTPNRANLLIKTLPSGASSSRVHFGYCVPGLNCLRNVPVAALQCCKLSPLMELLYSAPVAKTVIWALMSIWVHLVQRGLLRRSESWYIVHSGKHFRTNPSLFHEKRVPKEVRWFSQDHTQLVRVGVGVSVRIFVVVVLSLLLQNNRNSLC